MARLPILHEEERNHAVSQPLSVWTIREQRPPGTIGGRGRQAI